MAIRRSKPQSQPQKQPAQPAQSTQPARPSADPYTKGETKGSLIWSVSRFMERLFSHQGMFWLGVAIALVCYCCNIWFYYGLLRGASDLLRWQALGVAWFISSFTTLFEVMPVVWNRSHRNVLNQIFVAGAKPQTLPELNPKTVGDAEELMNAYRNSDRETRNFFATMRWMAIAVEAFIGFVFLGAIGSGLRALISIGLFLASIFGCEWGVSLALRSAQWELPPAIRQQLDEVISNAGKALSLKRI